MDFGCRDLWGDGTAECVDMFHNSMSWIELNFNLSSDASQVVGINGSQLCKAAPGAYQDPNRDCCRCFRFMEKPPKPCSDQGCNANGGVCLNIVDADLTDASKFPRNTVNLDNRLEEGLCHKPSERHCCDCYEVKVCINDKDDNGEDTGCSSGLPRCIGGETLDNGMVIPNRANGMPGLSCHAIVNCTDDAQGNDLDTGCTAQLPSCSDMLNGTTTGTKCGESQCLGLPAEIAIVVDRSGSMNSAWTSITTWMKALTAAYKIDGINRKGGLVLWSDDILETFTVLFTEKKTAADFEAIIQRMPLPDGGTYGGMALNYTYSTLFAVGSDPSVFREMIFISDGVSSDDLAWPATQFHNNNIQITAVALGSFDTAQLNTTMPDRFFVDADIVKVNSAEFTANLSCD